MKYPILFPISAVSINTITNYKNASFRYPTAQKQILHSNKGIKNKIGISTITFEMKKGKTLYIFEATSLIKIVLSSWNSISVAAIYSVIWAIQTKKIELTTCKASLSSLPLLIYKQITSDETPTTWPIRAMKADLFISIPFAYLIDNSVTYPKALAWFF